MNYNEEIAKLQKKLNKSFDNRERALLSDKIRKLINERDNEKYSNAKKVKPIPVVIKKEDHVEKPVEDKSAKDKVVEPVKEEPKKEKDKVEIVKDNNKYDKKKDKKKYSQGPSAIKDNTNPVIVDSRHSGTASVTI